MSEAQNQRLTQILWTIWFDEKMHLMYLFENVIMRWYDGFLKNIRANQNLLSNLLFKIVIKNKNQFSKKLQLYVLT